ncbi:MAG: acetyl-CoA hydrolase/transferase family protein [Bdellovibrionaceae bacterium]|nr:acetyl-CoA hydrolase/transferase family protein [Pseudobdellovibrionaceae bacterium]
MKLCSSFEEALKVIKSDSTVFVHGAAATPFEMLRVLTENSDHLRNVEMIHIHTEGECFYAQEKYKDRFRITSLFTGKNLRGKLDYERIDYLPCFLSEIPLLFRRGLKKIDVALIQVSPPDDHGYVSLGVSVDVAKAAVECADVVVAHINPRMPRVHGSGFISIHDIDYAVEYDAPLHATPPKPSTDVELAIGKNVASLVEDGATLQLGIGAIPNAVAENLTHHKHLGLHTEMWSDGALSLLKRGVIDNSRKSFQQGISTSAFVIGSQDLYDFIDDNMTTINLETSYVNYPINIMRNPKVTAINSAVEIDLTGQVCADSVGSKIISGVGGQMDFIRAAALSEGGKPIFALSSMSPKGASRLVTRLKPGAGVVTTRAHIHYVATEYGVVNLFGKTLNERAKALIGISHPSVREQLEREWSELKRQISAPL